MTPERIAAVEAAAAENDASAAEVLESMLEPAGAGAAPVNGGAANGAGSAPALDEAVSPVAGRRFSRG
jgi:hypothetical protein